MEGILEPFQYFWSRFFKCFFQCGIFLHLGHIWSPKVAKREVLGGHFDDILGGWANMRKSMFYVGESSILRVLEGPGTVTFRGVFLKG